MPERKSATVPAMIAAVAVLTLLAVVVAPSLSGGSGAPDADEGGSTPPGGAGSSGDAAWEQLARRDPDDPLARGDVDAPVVMIAYSDFQCPFCGKFARDTEPQLVEKYVEDGTLRIEWRDFPYLGPESDTLADAGRAAAAQDRFWDFHEAVYADQPSPNSGRVDDEYLADLAADLGLDAARFEEDRTSPRVERAVREDFVQGQRVGVTGTPAFIINGTPVMGAQPPEVFESTIEQAAAEAGR